MIYYNIHTHIFNLKCAPNSFYGIPLGNVLSNRNVARPIVFVLKKLLPGKGDLLSRYAKMLQIGSEKSQYNIFMDLLKSYEHLKVKFVVLSLDMDKMEGGNLINNYETQIWELREVKKKYPNSLLPFLSIDPRKDYKPNLKAYLQDRFERYGFTGIKLYPALGFYPFNPSLKELYSFATENNLPIIVHCTKGGVYYQGRVGQEHIYPLSLNPESKHDFSKDATEKMKVFKNNFTNPANWEEVLELYPKLKLCFAHYGGSSQIIKSRDKNASASNNYYLKLKEMLQNPAYENLYADISYTLSDIKKIKNEVLGDMRNPKLKNKILFGTDYYLTIQEKREKKLFDSFLKQINASEFNQISVQNASTFLQSEFYKPN